MPPSPEHEHEPLGALARLLRNSGINAVGTALSLLLNFVAVFLLARRLGKEGLGGYFLLFTFGLLLYFVLESGIATMLTRRIAADPRQLRRHVSEATGLLSVLCALAVGIMGIIGAGFAFWNRWMESNLTPSLDSVETAIVPLFILGGIACAARLVMEVYAGAFRGLERFECENVARVLQAAIFALMVWLFVHPPEVTGLYVSVGILALSNVASAVFIVGALHWGWHCVGVRLNKAIARDWLRESLPLGVGDLVQRIAWQVDTILLGQMRPWTDVGIYSIAFRPLQPLNLVPRTILSVTFPQFTRLANVDRGALSDAFARSIRFLWIVSVPISIAICVAAEPLILLSAGPEFREAVTPMRILIWVINLSFISTQFRFLFTAMGKQSAYVRIVLPLLVVRVLVEAGLIAGWGYFGACAGSFLAETAFVAAGLWACRVFGLGGLQWSEMARAALAGVAMAAALWPLREMSWPLLAGAEVLAGFGYLGLCFLLGAVKRDELKLLWDALQTFRRRKARSSSLPVSELSEPLADSQANATTSAH